MKALDFVGKILGKLTCRQFSPWVTLLCNEPRQVNFVEWGVGGLGRLNCKGNAVIAGLSPVFNALLVEICNHLSCILVHQRKVAILFLNTWKWLTSNLKRAVRWKPLHDYKTVLVMSISHCLINDSQCVDSAFITRWLVETSHRYLYNCASACVAIVFVIEYRVPPPLYKGRFMTSHV